MCSQVQEDETYAVTVNRGILSLQVVKFKPSHLLLIHEMNFGCGRGLQFLRNIFGLSIRVSMLVRGVLALSVSKQELEKDGLGHGNGVGGRFRGVVFPCRLWKTCLQKVTIYQRKPTANGYGSMHVLG